VFSFFAYCTANEEPIDAFVTQPNILNPWQAVIRYVGTVFQMFFPMLSLPYYLLTFSSHCTDPVHLHSPTLPSVKAHLTAMVFPNIEDG